MPVDRYAKMYYMAMLSFVPVWCDVEDSLHGQLLLRTGAVLVDALASWLFHLVAFSSWTSWHILIFRNYHMYRAVDLSLHGS